MLLNKAAATVAIPGGLTVGDGSTAATVRLLRSGQIASAAAVKINAAAVLDLNGQGQTLGSLTLVGGSVTGGLLTLAGNVAGSASATTAVISSGLDLGGTARTFSIAAGSTLAAQDLVISGAVGNGALTKSGAGTLVLSGNNTFTGGVTVSGGALQLGGAGALNATGANSLTFAASSTKLQLNGQNAAVSGLYISSGGTSPIVENGSAATAATLTVQLPSGTTDTYAAVLRNGSTAALNLCKDGAGTLVLTGTGNTYTGSTTVTAGTLKISGTGKINATSRITLNGPDAQFITTSSTAVNRTFTLTQGTLGGTGTITTAIVSGPGVTIAPGDRTLATPAKGTLTIQNAVNLVGGTTDLRLFSGTANDSDKLVQSSSGKTITFGGALKVTQSGSWTFASGQSWDLFNWSSTPTTTFTTLDLPVLSGLAWNTGSLYTTGVISLVGAPSPMLTISTPDYTRVLKNTAFSVSGSVTNATGAADFTNASLTDNGGQLTASAFNPAVPFTVAYPDGNQAFAASVATGDTLGVRSYNIKASNGANTASDSKSLTVVDARTLSAAPVAFTVHAGALGSASTGVTSSSGDHATVADVTLATGADNGFAITGNGAAFVGGSLNPTGSVTLSKVFSTPGIQTGVVTLRGGNGLTPEMTGGARDLAIGYTVQVFSGQAKWNLAGGSTWLADANWTDAGSSATAGAPGVSGLTGVYDTASFDDMSAPKAAGPDGASGPDGGQSRRRRSLSFGGHLRRPVEVHDRPRRGRWNTALGQRRRHGHNHRDLGQPHDQCPGGHRQRHAHCGRGFADRRRRHPQCGQYVDDRHVGRGRQDLGERRHAGQRQLDGRLDRAEHAQHRRRRKRDDPRNRGRRQRQPRARAGHVGLDRHRVDEPAGLPPAAIEHCCWGGSCTAPPGATVQLSPQRNVGWSIAPFRKDGVVIHTTIEGAVLCPTNDVVKLRPTEGHRSSPSARRGRDSWRPALTREAGPAKSPSTRGGLRFCPNAETGVVQSDR